MSKVPKVPKQQWAFATRFRRRAFGWRSQPAIARIKEAEIEEEMRSTVADYCLLQAKLGKPYNLNFLDTATEDAFYCSHLAYQAYLKVGIDLNSGKGMPNIPGTESLVAGFLPKTEWGSMAVFLLVSDLLDCSKLRHIFRSSTGGLSRRFWPSISSERCDHMSQPG